MESKAVELSGAGTGRVQRVLALVLALLAVLAFTGRGYQDERAALHFRDFKQPYASARCVLTHCDPYSEPDTRAAFLAAGGVDDDKVVFDPYSALYPPFSLLALTPIAALPYPVAHTVWEALVAAAFSAAVLLMADLCVAVSEASLVTVLLLAVFTFSSTILLMLGQVSGLVIALLAIGFACLMRGRFLPLAALCLCLAVLLKPHDAAIPLLYLLFAGRRWRLTFAAVAVVSILFAAGSIVWFDHMPSTAHWLPELRANLAGNAGAGAVNNPAGHIQGLELTNLQAIFALVRDNPAFYNNASFAVTLLLLLAWAAAAARLPNTLPKHVLAIAAISCLALLPIYHRQYDTRILLLVFPAVAYLAGRRGHRAWGFLGLALLAGAIVLTAHQVHSHFLLPRLQAIQQASAARTLLLYRPLQASVLVLFLYLLASMFQERFRESRTQVPGDRRSRASA